MREEMTYRQVGEVMLPNITMGETGENTQPLGRYGMLRKRYLEQYRPVTYSSMVLDGTLYPNLREIDRAADWRLAQLMDELAARHPAPGKGTDPMGWVGQMNSLKAQAEETIFAELIYS